MVGETVGQKRKGRDLANAKKKQQKLREQEQDSRILSLVSTYEPTFYLWSPDDDIMLQQSMLTIGDYAIIAKNTHFSYNFTKEEVEARWMATLYHPIHSFEVSKRLSKEAKMKSQVPWNEWEEEILRYEILVHYNFDFQDILEKHRTQFHFSRTARSLEAHYGFMRRSHTFNIADSIWLPHEPSPLPSEANPSNKEIRKKWVSPEGQSLFDSKNITPREIERLGMEGEGLPVLTAEHEHMETKTSKEITKKQYAYMRKAMTDKEKIEKLELVMNRFVTRNWGDAFALLRGMKMRAFIRSEKVIIGRKSNTFTPDIDLSEEGSVKGISRSHVELTMTHQDGKFSIKNIGKASVYVNGNMIASGRTSVLYQYSFLEIGPAKLIFEINLPFFTHKPAENHEDIEMEEEEEEEYKSPYDPQFMMSSRHIAERAIFQEKPEKMIIKIPIVRKSQGEEVESSSEEEEEEEDEPLPPIKLTLRPPSPNEDKSGFISLSDTPSSPMDECSQTVETNESLKIPLSIVRTVSFEDNPPIPQLPSPTPSHREDVSMEDATQKN